MVGKFDGSLAPSPGTNMVYQLTSAVQVENGARLFWPHFGFFYKAVATKISVYLYDLATSSEVKIIDEGIVNPIGNTVSSETEWKYISKNLSTVAELTSMWNSGSEKLWQGREKSPYILKVEILL